MTCARVHVPDTEQYRIWLKKSLLLLGIKPSRLAKNAGISINSASKFLSGSGDGGQHDVRLNTASRLYEQVKKEAAVKGVTLPALEAEEEAQADE